MRAVSARGRLFARAASARRRLSTAVAHDSPLSHGLVIENELLRREVASLKSKLNNIENPVVDGEVTKFAGAQSLYTNDLHFYYPHAEDPPATFPCFRIMDDLGDVVPGAEEHVPELDRDLALGMMYTMVRVSEYDKIFLDAQRQGRISFYMTSRGEEAAAVGSAAALSPQDWVLPQYRELGVFFWRGLSFDDVANQLCSNGRDPAHGRQLPLHVGKRDGHLLYVKSTLGTQAPHAAGVAYATRIFKQDRVAITYFGEGCASEGDIPSALNIAAVHNCPTIFFCRNNGYAISTSVRDQYASDGIAPRGPAYGLPTIRVDGNDILAVAVATRRAREIALTEGRPCLIEAMTYRIGAHSTSDDDTKYRNPTAPEEGWDSERAYWEARSPIIRFGRYLQSKGWWSPTLEDDVRVAARREAIASLNRASAVSKPHFETLFTDVYDEPEWMQREQKEALVRHMDKYPEHYNDVLRA